MPSASIFVLGLVPIAALPAATPDGVAPAAADHEWQCPRSKVQVVADEREEGFKRLGELPPAAHILTVLRRDGDGCEVPIVVRYGIGAPEAKDGHGG